MRYSALDDMLVGMKPKRRSRLALRRPIKVQNPTQAGIGDPITLQHEPGNSTSGTPTGVKESIHYSIPLTCETIAESTTLACDQFDACDTSSGDRPGTGESLVDPSILTLGISHAGMTASTGADSSPQSTRCTVRLGHDRSEDRGENEENYCGYGSTNGDDGAIVGAISSISERVPLQYVQMNASGSSDTLLTKATALPSSTQGVKSCCHGSSGGANDDSGDDDSGDGDHCENGDRMTSPRDGSDHASDDGVCLQYSLKRPRSSTVKSRPPPLSPPQAPGNHSTSPQSAPMSPTSTSHVQTIDQGEENNRRRQCSDPEGSSAEFRIDATEDDFEPEPKLHSNATIGVADTRMPRTGARASNLLTEHGSGEHCPVCGRAMSDLSIHAQEVKNLNDILSRRISSISQFGPTLDVKNESRLRWFTEWLLITISLWYNIMALQRCVTYEKSS